MKYTTLNINPELHKRIVEYCRERGLKIGAFVERSLKKILDNNP